MMRLRLCACCAPSASCSAGCSTDLALAHGEGGSWRFINAGKMRKTFKIMQSLKRYITVLAGALAALQAATSGRQLARTRGAGSKSKPV